MESDLSHKFGILAGLGLNLDLQGLGLTPGQADTAVNAVRRGDEDVLKDIFAPRNMLQERDVQQLQETGKVPLLGLAWFNKR